MDSNIKTEVVEDERDPDVIPSQYGKKKKKYYI